MSDLQSPDNVQARAAQEDPIIMYLIVRESLNMSVGKTAAQCAHASQMLLLKYWELYESEKERCAESLSVNDINQSQLDLFSKWLNSSFRKVVLRADDKEWAKLKSSLEENDVIVVDAGLTEIPAQSETVIGLCPMRKSLVGKLIKRLQVLK